MQRVEEAFKELANRLTLILPVLIIVILDFMVDLVIEVLIPPTLLTRIGISIINGIAFSFAISMVFSGYMTTPSLYEEWRDTSSRLNCIIELGIILGFFFFIFSYIPFGFLLNSLALAFLLVSFPFVYKSGIRGINQSLQWLTRAISEDALSFIIIYLSALLSFFPVIDILLLPYGTILGYIVYREVI
ncbi:hypothetical protein [Acidianus brierleyi]|uniref:DUF4013 domain-containing protein n=1 Tax=Acidianus brierleyi TaxID=41673 RepID=A0A2U9IDV1_9CREN|nr:hypothetical protein [Acidianus brierleyi]AWR94205.1 hypothetical protein DFR85_05975 [Acidianus brierleyi]